MIFDSCYQWQWVNDRSGNFNLVGFPMQGGIMEQYNHVLEIMDIIKTEAKTIILKNIK